MNKYDEFRKKYPNFIYDKFELIEDNEYLIIKYYFEIENLKKFNPTIRIKKNKITNKKIDKTFLEPLSFHIGLIELVSYWKATCSPNVFIKAGYLDKVQINWFKKLYFYGLGEFFYTNNINPDIETFMNVECSGKRKTYSIDYHGTGNLIPIGGGKDSIVSLELLKRDFDINDCFIINPKKINLECAYTGGYNDNKIITVSRTIDQNLIELNKEGFLNGHTPFSSLVAFVTYLVAYLTNKKYIILSNEASANESNVEGTNINHQYSKTYEFENDFNNYTKKYFNIEIKYFSLLRPLSEYQIGMIFKDFSKYHKVFKSCNVGSKDKNWHWCCNCPKCLFVYIILSPHLYKNKLINIFGEDLFERKDLLETFISLTGRSNNKPFECVGTYEEVNYAISKTISKLNNLPYLLKYYKDNYEIDTSLNLEKRWNDEHNLDKYFLDIVRGSICTEK